MGKKISDNPTAAEMMQAAEAARLIASLGILPSVGPLADAAKALAEVVDKAGVLTLPDRFNTAFSGLGWVTCGSMPTEAMESAIALKTAGRTDDAEQLLAEIFDEPTLRFLIMRSHRFHKVYERKPQLEEAKALFLEGRYLAATPLLLMASDGLAYDVGGFSVFSEHADLTAFDSIVGHPTGLPALIGLIRAPRSKTTGDPISIPYRHGMLHGRDSGYGNRIACAKAWHLFQALVDWAQEKAEEPGRIAVQRQKASQSFGDIIDEAVTSAARRDAEKKALDAWTARDLPGLPHVLEPGSPEEALHDYLVGWASGNFMLMSSRSINLVGKSAGKLAYEARRDARGLKLTDFRILRFEDTTPSSSHAETMLTFETSTGRREMQLSIGVMLDLGKDGIHLRGPMARWQVMGHALQEARRRLGEAGDQESVMP